MSRALGLAAAASAALVGGSLLLRLANPFGAPAPSPSDLVPHLWGVGALVVVALTNNWAPTLGWSASIVAASAAALGAVGFVREVRLVNGGRSEPVLDALVVLALLVPLVVAAGYATVGRRRPRALTAAVWVLVAVIGGVLVANDVRRTLGFETGGVPEWVWLLAIGALAVVGLVRDMRPAVAATRARLSADGRGTDRAGGALSALRVFVDELVPGREAGRVEAAESERGRLAADLHADVLPSLRRALAEAEAGGTVERLAADLRTAVEDVESLLAARRSIVLEEMGLLAAVEWLAERVEERSAVRVDIEVVESTPGPASARPPREVERSAFRVAQLALDNVVRHAPTATARVRVVVLPRDVRLEIEDDGEGPPVDEAAAARSGRRGIADMRAEARACGATLEVGRGAGDRGTTIRFSWPVV